MSINQPQEEIIIEINNKEDLDKISKMKLDLLLPQYQQTDDSDGDAQHGENKEESVLPQYQRIDDSDGDVQHEENKDEPVLPQYQQTDDSDEDVQHEENKDEPVLPPHPIKVQKNKPPKKATVKVDLINMTVIKNKKLDTP